MVGKKTKGNKEENKGSMLRSCWGGRRIRPDDNKNVIVNAPDSRASNTDKGVIHLKVGDNPSPGRTRPEAELSPNEYLKILQPKKGKKRMDFNPNLPKTLTPKGYAKIKPMLDMANKQYEILVNQMNKAKKLWEDPDFPANDSSIGAEQLEGKIEWKRSTDINPQAEIFVGGASRFDIEQGALGDCWLLAVISSISSYPHLFDQVVPKDQKVKCPDYAGIFRARIWRYGQWVEVLVDDRLPCYKGTNQLVFMHSADSTEFWSALLEKAYAKLNGCYHNLSGGTQSEAMEDLTGGLCETTELTDGARPEGFAKQLKSYVDRCCLMGCSVDSKIIEAKLDNGLIAGHAYSVTGATIVSYNGANQMLVRCRNPWGGKYEWKGAWSDKSEEWKKIPAKELKQLSVEFNDDGEFWMSYEDFIKCFSRLEVCHLGLESLEYNQDFRGKRRLEESIFSGRWEKKINAGGCINNRTTYWTNPQFRITVKDPDPYDEDQMCSLIIGLMQKDVRSKSGADFKTIGFMVYSIDASQAGLLNRSQVMTKKTIGKSKFSNTREATASLRMKPGDYVVIPSTFEPDLEGQFILRVFCQVAIDAKELDDDNSHPDVPEDVIESLKLEDMILNEDPEIEVKFNTMMDKTKQSIDALDLKELLNTSSLQDMPEFEGFNTEMCRSMLASVDQNLTGEMEFSEFSDLWQHAKAWKLIFLKHDKDSSGFFQASEFREALKSAGYCVSNKLFNALVHRYQDAKTERMRFEEFMLCCVRLKTVFETVAAQPKTSEGAPMFNEEDYLRCSVYI